MATRVTASSEIVPRRATSNDTRHVTDVFLKSMPDDPSWRYRFPYRLEYPEDHQKYNGDLIRRFISPDYEDWLVMVIEAEDPGNGTNKIVAFSIWDMTYVNVRKHGTDYKPKSRKVQSSPAPKVG